MSLKHNNSNPHTRLVHFARENRRQSTTAESMLWRLLRRNALDGFKFRRQHPIEHFIVDFVCLERRLVIELDGTHHGSGDQEKQDLSRVELLKQADFKIIRFWNHEVLRDTENVVNKIRFALENGDFETLR